MNQLTTFPEVMTLEEVAVYLRLPEATIEQHALQGQLPGRRVAETWRFLKTALDEWLRAQDRRTILLQQAGALAGDETMDELRDSIYAKRGRAETE